MSRRNRFLVVNADDFGLSEDTNRGIMEAHQQGIVTSASLMVRYPASLKAADYGRAHPELSLGLHFDIGEWAYRGGEWVELYRVVPFDDAEEIESELAWQLQTFRAMVGQDPTHLDSHQHIHREEPARSILIHTAQELGIPLRECSPSIRYIGGFYGQASHGEPWPQGIRLAALVDMLEHLPEGISELGCHPGLDAALNSAYREERIIEVITLCDPLLRSALGAFGITTISFREAQQRSKLAHQVVDPAPAGR